MSMCINVEFLAGTTIEDAIRKAKDKACQWDVSFVCFDFNGSKFSVSRNADIEHMVKQWREEDRKYGLVG